jgi:alpha-amylase
MFVYGEVIGNSLAESNLYTPYMAVTDFHLLSLMLGTFTVGGSMANLVHPEGWGLVLPGNRSVVFARNHDTVMNPNFFAFADYQDALLATAFVLARGVGMPKIYRDDAYQEIVAAAVRFHNRAHGQSTYVRKASEICSGCNNDDFLVIERGHQAVAMINKADAWLDVSAARLPGVEPGCYRDLRYGTSIEVGVGGDGQRWISAWGTDNRGGLRIGPRSAMFFVRSSRCPH